MALPWLSPLDLGLPIGQPNPVVNLFDPPSLNVTTETNECTHTICIFGSQVLRAISKFYGDEHIAPTATQTARFNGLKIPVAEYKNLSAGEIDDVKAFYGQFEVENLAQIVEKQTRDIQALLGKPSTR
ncbi:hypothetical protein CPB83DRAFT_900443 [Crepidotus variabilis]|uniref:Uncharacterized protein n=1 Tax=Crepidotus variabilis TaxID=179855 RepID=A0A9P6E354_9AGAR|nr:hypothetical protein CPB83DRAFT_900443 [Crepidotus variabilis]